MNVRRGISAILSLFSACLALTGCTVDQHAMMLIEQDTQYGKRNIALVGPSDQLVKNKKDTLISATRIYTMPDGTKIDVWIYKALPKTEPRGTILVLHGLGDSKVTYMKMARMLARKGFDVVLTDLRAHGRSTGRFVTYGALEKNDQRITMNELYKEKVVSEPLYVFGLELGGAVAIQYAAIDPRVKGVMAVRPYRDITSAARSFFKLIAPLMSEEDIQKVIVKAGEIGKFKPAEASALKDIPKVSCSVLLVHGKLDMSVPYDDSKALFAAANEPKELELLPWASHLSIFFGREAKIVKDIEKLASGKVGKDK